MEQTETNESILYTGGVTGSDQEWIKAAIQKRHLIKVYRFDGVKHTRIETLNGTGTEGITSLDEHDDKVKLCLARVAEHTHSSIPTDPARKYLLVRDYYLIQEPTSLYAICEFGGKSRLNITGHTSWIIEMFVDKLLDSTSFIEEEHNDTVLPVHVYFQDKRKWFTLHIMKDPVSGISRFNWINVKVPESPKGKYLGIGSRDLSMDGKLEILYL
jgi:hypothetical protein